MFLIIACRSLSLFADGYSTSYLSCAGGVGVALGVGDGLGNGVGVAAGVGLGDGVGVGVGIETTPPACAANS